MTLPRALFALLFPILAASPGMACAAAPATQETGDARKPDGSYLYTNRLAKEKSPYLLQHAHNPVDWYPWGAEAFARAKKEDKPIFLSIGYSTCHWCHVMEKESFSNPEVAKLINDNFIAIKIDREERPDLDRVYMTFVQAANGSGGWPMTVFVTPDLKPFFGGTYFPPEDRDGSIGLKSLLTRVHESWGKDHQKIVEFSDSVAKELRQAAAATTVHEGALDAGTLAAARARYAGLYDAEFGGFGRPPKFPEPQNIQFLFHAYAATGDKPACDMALRTLRAMADGGMHDQLGGGFHRYATDRRWFLPHFEKMLYDQAQLASAYLDAYQITHEELYAAVARDIFDYVLRDMTGPDGQFYSAEDADSALDATQPEKRGEGAFYVWSAEEIEKTLGADAAAVFNYRYGVEPNGNVALDPRGEFPGKNILFVAHSIDETSKKFAKPEAALYEILEPARKKLLEIRTHRPRPRRDDKSLAAWNGLMIGALARGGIILDEPRYTAAATRAAQFVRAKLYDPADHKLSRSYLNGPAGIDGFLSDYAFCIQGFLDLYESGGDIAWLKLALDLQAGQDKRFWDDKDGGYFAASADDATLLIRQKDEGDNAEPAGNSIACLNLLRLGRMTDDKAMTDRGGKVLHCFSEGLVSAPSGWPAMLTALDFRLAKPRQIVIATKPGAADARAMLRVIAEQYHPNQVILLADGGEGQAFLASRVELLAGMKPKDGKATAYICENFACQLPTNDPGKVREMVGK